MFTLRCTAKLRERLRVADDAPPTPPSTKLGDWYANLIFVRPQLVLCVSERTLLPVLIPARDASTLVPRLSDAVGDILRALGIPETAIAAEQEAMRDAGIAKTASRQVLGFMKEFAFQFDVHRGSGSLLEISLCLADTPCAPLGMTFPWKETIGVFALSAWGARYPQHLH